MSDGGLRLRLALHRPAFTLDVELALPAHGISVLYGPSGCGKTTLLRCVAGLERGTGTISLGGQDWQDDGRRVWRPAWQRPVGYVFQEASLFPHLSVRGNLRYAQKRAPRGAGGIALDDVLDLLGIAHLLDRGTQDLSGGERQRVAIARALATQPQLLLLDEPLAALDAARKREVLPWLERLRDRLQLPMLYVTHAPEEMARLADTLVLLEGGYVRASGPAAKMFRHFELHLPDTDELGTVVQGRIRQKDEAWGLLGVELIDGSVIWIRDEPVLSSSTVRLHILAADVSLSVSPPDPSTISIQNSIRGRVELIRETSHQSQAEVIVNLGSETIVARVTKKAVASLNLRIGVPVWALVKSAKLIH